MASWARIKVEPSAADYCTSEEAGRGTHLPGKWLITEGPSSRSANGTGKVICRACGGRKGRQAVGNWKRSQTSARKVGAPKASRRARASAGPSFPARHWGWIAVIVGWAVLATTYWLVSAGLAVAGLFYFIRRSPLPCLGLPEPCATEARGIFRRCGEPEHRRHNWATLKKAVAEGKWPGQLWPDRAGRRAAAGVALAALLLAASAAGYGWTVVF